MCILWETRLSPESSYNYLPHLYNCIAFKTWTNLYLHQSFQLFWIFFECVLSHLLIWHIRRCLHLSFSSSMHSSSTSPLVMIHHHHRSRMNYHPFHLSLRNIWLSISTLSSLLSLENRPYLHHVDSAVLASTHRFSALCLAARWLPAPLDISLVTVGCPSSCIPRSVFETYFSTLLIPFPDLCIWRPRMVNIKSR